MMKIIKGIKTFTNNILNILSHIVYLLAESERARDEIRKKLDPAGQMLFDRWYPSMFHNNYWMW